MPQVDRTSRAEHDLAGIVAHIAADNLPASLRWLDKIERVFDLLAKMPELGEQYEAGGRALRRFVEGNYVVYYEPKSDGVTIIRVLHGAQEHERMV